ncbi:hypothetical protein [Campylobacter corcagiensis]|uniref:Uncharacterized protein n=1 Tax=Campylobacter corcagiensis TaxID=1448857 RepID=A0A7M1LE53_9BACT|nr:hypothetical protein [Campylobacter corcagiensis]QOQ86740.1 hypothetical protein IMC76_05825 [Campylobacter corcagiensis]
MKIFFKFIIIGVFCVGLNAYFYTTKDTQFVDYSFSANLKRGIYESFSDFFAIIGSKRLSAQFLENAKETYAEIALSGCGLEEVLVADDLSFMFKIKATLSYFYHCISENLARYSFGMLNSNIYQKNFNCNYW